MKRVERVMLTMMMFFVLGLGLDACSQGAANLDQPTATHAITGEATTTKTHTAIITQETPTVTPSPETKLTPTALPCGREVCVFPGHFVLNRPISAANNDNIDTSYRYGSTQNGRREAHHGVEFVNPHGTSVLAAADGTIIVAGNDHSEVYSDWPFFYGNLIIIEHAIAELQFPIYTLYAHLSEVHVEVGQQVQVGETIGLVGLSGTAIGAHLHFEVRIGKNSYRETRNPELWLQPHSDENGDVNGAIIGRAIDEFGDVIPLQSIEIKMSKSNEDGKIRPFYLSTYANLTVNGDLTWEESFAIGDLPAGNYRVSFIARGLQYFDVEVLPGMVTMITFDAGNE